MLKDPPRGYMPGLYLLTTCFVAGVTSTIWLSALPSPWWALAILPVVLLVRRFSWLVLPAVFLGGAAWAVLRADMVLQHSLPDGLAGRDLVVQGRIVSLPQGSGRIVRFDFDVDRLWFGTTIYPSPGRVRLRVYDQVLDLEPGARWRFVVRLRRAHGFRNPGGFDYERHLFRHGIRATGYVRRGGDNARIDGPPPLRVAALRHRFSEYVSHREALSNSRALIAALGVGDRSQLSARQWAVLTATGTNHLMAISGLHVGLIAGLAFWLGTRIWRLCGRAVVILAAPYAGAVCAVVAATGYAMLAGFSTPTQRALIMLLCVMWALLSGRPSNVGQGLAVAICIVLLLDPLNVLDAGFWLSFVAVIAIALIVAAAPRIRAWRQWLRVQIWLGLVLGPFTVAWFGQWPILAPVANLIAVPVVGFAVVPVTLIGVAAVSLGVDSVAGPAVSLAAWVLDQVLLVLERLSNLPASLWRPAAAPSWWAVAAALGGIAWLLLPTARHWRMLGALWLLPLVTDSAPGPGHGTVVTTVLDVGQGLAVVVRTDNHVLVYDTGARLSSNFDLGTAVVVPYLRHQGVARIDTMIISHGDNDHIGGAASVLAALPVGEVLSSVPERLPAALPCISGQHWRWDGVDFTIMHPDVANPIPHNNASCVLRISTRHGSVLLTGDIEAQAEAALIRRDTAELTADVLLVPHQGSKTSSTPRFIDAVAPRLAVVSAGHRNRYGHPAPEVVARYAARGIPLLDTASLGAVRVTISSTGMGWSGARLDDPRYWSDKPPRAANLQAVSKKSVTLLKD